MRCATSLSEESPCPPPSRRTPPAPPTSRCWATRSGTASTAPPPGTRTARPSSTSRPVADGPTPSSSPGSTRWRSDCSRAGVRTGDRVGIWAPNVAEWVFVQYATAKIGAILVNINPVYRTHELEYVLNQSGVALLVAARSFKTSDYAGMIEEVRPRCAELQQVVLLGSPEWDALASGKRRPGRAGAGAGVAEPGRPDQHPVHVRHHGLPQGRHAQPPQHRQQRVLRREPLRLHRRGPGLHPRALLPLLRHGHGQPRLHHPRRHDGHPRARLRPGRDAARPSPRSGAPRSTGCRRCSSPSSNVPDFDSYDLSSLRTGIMAGSPCPVEVMKQVVDRMGMTEVTICYGMTETSPVSTQTRADDTLDRRVSTVGRVHPHVEVKVVDPVTGRTSPRGEPGELCTRGYSVMLGYWNEPEKTAEAIDARALDAHRRRRRSWTTPGTSTSPAGSRTSSCAAGRTSRRARSRSSSTRTRTCVTCRSSGYRTCGTGRSCAPG